MKFFLVASLVALVALVDAKDCRKGWFSWHAGFKGDICLPSGGATPPGTPPTGLDCPANGWQWCNYNKICVPKNEVHPAPKCKKGKFDWKVIACHCASGTGHPPHHSHKPYYKRAIEQEGRTLDAEKRAEEQREILGRRQYKPKKIAAREF